MSLGHGASIVKDGLGFAIDFRNIKSIAETSLADMSANKIPITLTNPGSNTISIVDGYAEFSPPDVSSTAAYYTISNSYFNSIKNEITLETSMYVYDNFGNNQFVRGVSPRTTETSSPLGFSIGVGNIATEINTTTGWNTATTSNSNIGYNRWVYVTQTTSVTSNKFITYINGLQVKEQVFTGTPNGGNGLLIGRGFYGGIKNYNGRVSFVRVYNRALTASEIQQNFNALRGRYGI